MCLQANVNLYEYYGKSNCENIVYRISQGTSTLDVQTLVKRKQWTKWVGAGWYCAVYAEKRSDSCR